MSLLNSINGTTIGIFFFILFNGAMIVVTCLTCTDKTEYEKLHQLSRFLNCSEYHIFMLGSRVWKVSRSRMEEDFARYLKTSSIPFYVRDFIRKELPAFLN